ncbi:AAA family ATPase [Arthrobacter woluwensis]|uniref:MinD-like ATPase involved in chromosome partitioning or flagellar assembly n=1 Tax=Arthrobacter woluwensis TaxID=156980 RepID=A0A1H4MWX0_9MICC|nr:P-loop NTPase [Arthrobacter woluwensis]SEB87005.1 MinD-like ATPase involved in chromosome partitioning or flagellar assembly [Arthrobacter woluwensis]
MTVSIAAHGSGSGVLAEQLNGRRHGAFRVVRQSESLEELMGACQAGLAQVALFVGDDHSLDATTVDRLRALGVIVLILSPDRVERERLSRVGAVTLPADAGVAQVEEILSSALDVPGRRSDPPAVTGDGGAPGPRIRPGISWARVGHSGFAVQPSPDSTGPTAPVSADSGGVESEGTDSEGSNPGEGSRVTKGSGRNRPDGTRSAEEHPGPPGVLAVWGPAGAPGRTTVAVNLAAELAMEGRRVVLLDADTYGASVASHLGLLDESAGLAQACRLADQGRFDGPALERCRVPLTVGQGSLDVLSGLTRPERWTELRGPALSLVIDLCSSTYDHVVIDVGFCLEADEELSFDTMAPRRNAAALTALGAAERVYAVGEATAVGLPRLVRAIPSLLDAAPQAQAVVLMNKVRQDAVGRFPERQVREAWERFGPSLPIGSFLPFSPEIVDIALRNGNVLAESAPQSELRRAVRSVVCAPAQRSRKSSVFYTTTRWMGSR